MKRRCGFVSNSSSSSFCIVGVSDECLVKALYEKEVAACVKMVRGCQHKVSKSSKAKFCPECGTEMWVKEDIDAGELSHGQWSGKHLSFHGNDEPYYAGLEAEPLLEKMTIPEAKKAFAELCKKHFNLTIPADKVRLRYGECGEG
jgi:hypothetical protein